MECSQKIDNIKIIDLAEISHDYFIEIKIVLIIMNKNKIKITCKKTNVAILFLKLYIIQNEIEEFDKNLFNDMQNLIVLVLNSNKIKIIKNETFTAVKPRLRQLRNIP